MANMGSLTVWLNANTSNFNRGMFASVSVTKKLAMAVKAGSAIVAGSMLAIGAKSLQLFSQQERANRKLAGTLKATGWAAQLTSKEIQEYATQLQRATNVGDDQIVSAAGVMATFKNVTGETFKESISLANDMASVLDTSLNSAVVQLGKALNDPVRGLTALSRSGVSFTEAQKEQIKTLQESGDLLGAQAIIMAELRAEFGGAAAEMAKADLFQATVNGLGDMLEMFGEIIVKTFDVKDATQSMASLINGFVDDMKSDLDGIVVFFKSTGVGIEFLFRKTITGAKNVGLIVLAAVYDSINFVVSLAKTSFNVVKSIFDLMISSTKEFGSALWKFLKNPTKGFQFDFAKLEFDDKAFALNLKPSATKAMVQQMKEQNAALTAEEAKVQDEILEQSFNRINKETVKELDEIAKVKAAKKKAGDDVAKDVAKSVAATNGRNFAAALERGSVAAYSATLNRGQGGTTQAILKENQQQTSFLETIADMSVLYVANMPTTVTIAKAVRGTY